MKCICLTIDVSELNDNNKFFKHSHRAMMADKCHKQMVSTCGICLGFQSMDDNRDMEMRWAQQILTVVAAILMPNKIDFMRKFLHKDKEISI